MKHNLQITQVYTQKAHEKPSFQAQNIPFFFLEIEFVECSLEHFRGDDTVTRRLSQKVEGNMIFQREGGEHGRNMPK